MQRCAHVTKYHSCSYHRITRTPGEVVETPEPGNINTNTNQRIPDFLTPQRQEKEREYTQLMFEKQSIHRKLQIPASSEPKVKIAEPKVLKIALRKRQVL